MPTDETTLEALAAWYEREATITEARAKDWAEHRDPELRLAAKTFSKKVAEARLIADALRFRLVGTGEAELPAVRLAPQYDDATVVAFLEEAILQYSEDDAADSLLLEWAGIAAQRLATLAGAPAATAVLQADDLIAEGERMRASGRSPIKMNRCGPYMPEPGEHATDPAAQEGCDWTDDGDGSWATTCDRLWSFFDGSPTENGVKFCIGCGKPVRVVVAPPDDDEVPDGQ